MMAEAFIQWGCPMTVPPEDILWLWDFLYLFIKIHIPYTLISVLSWCLSSVSLPMIDFIVDKRCDFIFPWLTVIGLYWILSWLLRYPRAQYQSIDWLNYWRRHLSPDLVALDKLSSPKMYGSSFWTVAVITIQNLEPYLKLEKLSKVRKTFVSIIKSKTHNRVVGGSSGRILALLWRQSDKWHKSPTWPTCHVTWPPFVSMVAPLYSQNAINPS